MKNAGLSLSDALAEFNGSSSSVKLRLKADVEVAAYLSGGIDSAQLLHILRISSPGYSIHFQSVSTRKILMKVNFSASSELFKHKSQINKLLFLLKSQQTFPK